MALADTTVGTEGCKCIIAGDLNARSKELTGDHHTNARGKLLETVLESSDFQVQQPTKGKWTSFTHNGMGVPDLVLANFQIHDLVVHEQDACGGSDHRPLTFTVPDTRPKTKLVERWNICRLTKLGVIEKYAKALDEEMGQMAVAAECQSGRPGHRMGACREQSYRQWWMGSGHISQGPSTEQHPAQ